MGSIKLGNLSVDKMFVGDKRVDKAYYGSVLIYSGVVVGDSCTIANLGSSNPTSVTFTKTTGFPTAAQCYEEVTFNGDVFAKFTPWYKKAVFSGSELIGFVISNKKEDADFQPYDCFLDESGNLLPYILIGKFYLSSTSAASSVDAARATMTIGTGRSLCRARGTGYQQMDAAMQMFWRDLALACSETVDFNNGSGVASYLGLARMTEGGWWIDGLTHVDATYLYCSKPSKYVDSPTALTDGYSALSYAMPTSNGSCVSKLGYDSNHPTINFPSASVSNSSFNTYYCDGLYYNTGNRPCNVLVGYANAGNGLFYLNGFLDWSNALGVRLCYKPIS